MARSDLLINLIKAGTSGDQSLMRSTVDAIIAEERSKQHNLLADRIARAMNGTVKGAGNRSTYGFKPTQDRHSGGMEFLAEIRPRRRLEDLVVPDTELLSCRQLIEEQHRADVLRAQCLEPRHRILLVGPPGNGKTSLAEAVAQALAVPFFVVRYETMIGSYLGQTATRLMKVFEYVRTTPSVLFFDEFESIGKERGDKQETGEIKRVVSSLLMQIEDLPSHSVVMAATNHAEMLDRAVWRRFQLRIELPKPKQKALATFIDRFLGRFNEPTGMSSMDLARQLGAVSFSEAESFCLDVMRRHALAMGEMPLKALLSEQLRIWSTRVKPQTSAAEGASAVEGAGGAGTSSFENA